MPVNSNFANLAARAFRNSQGSAFFVKEVLATNTTSGTTLATASTSFDAGNVLIALVSWDPSGAATPTITGVSDGTNAFTSMGAQVTSPATTSSLTGVISQAWILREPTVGSKVITVTFSGATTKKAITVLEVENITTTQINTRTTSFGTATAATTGNLTTPFGYTGDLILAFSGWESSGSTGTGATDTTRGTWSTQSNNSTSGGATGTNITTSYQYKILTGNGTQTAVNGTNNAGFWTFQTFVLKAA